MPAQRTTTSILSKLGAQGEQAAEVNRTKPVEIELPGDVRGIARLTQCKFGEVSKGKDEGKPYFYLRGVVMEPPEHARKPFNITITIKEDKENDDKPYSHTMGKVQDILKMLLGSDIDYECLTLQRMETTAAALQKTNGPGQKHTYFRFHTWKPPVATEGPYKGRDTRVMHFCDGVCEYAEAEDTSLNGVVDESAPAPDATKAALAPTEGKAKPKAAVSVAAPAARGKSPTRKPEPEPEPEFNEFGDGGNSLDELAALADNGDEAAGAKLRELALAAGIARKVIDNARLWVSVAEMLKPTPAESAGDEESETGVEEASEGIDVEEPEEGPDIEEPEEEIPNVGETWQLTIKDAKGKPKVLDVEILSTNPKLGASTVKNLTTGRTIVDEKTKKPRLIAFKDLKPLTGG